MQVGSVVRYQCRYPDGMEIDWVGIVTEVKPPRTKDWRLFFRVQWNSGVLDWRPERDLEVICK